MCTTLTLSHIRWRAHSLVPLPTQQPLVKDAARIHCSLTVNPPRLLLPSPPAGCPEGKTLCGGTCIDGCCSSKNKLGEMCGETCIDTASEVRPAEVAQAVHPMEFPLAALGHILVSTAAALLWHCCACLCFLYLTGPHPPSPPHSAV